MSGIATLAAAFFARIPLRIPLRICPIFSATKLAKAIKLANIGELVKLANFVKIANSPIST